MKTWLSSWWNKPFAYGSLVSIVITAMTSWVLLDNFVWSKTGTSGEILLSSSFVSSSQQLSITPTFTDTSYRDASIQLTISTFRRYDTTIHLVHLVLDDFTLLKTALANDAYGKNINEKTSSMATRKNAIFAISGDYYGYRDVGFVMRNGILYRDIPRSSSNDDALVYRNNGQLTLIDEATTTRHDLIALSPRHVWTFGPSLIKAGEITVTETSKIPYEYTSNPRAAIAQVNTNEYYFLVSEGRTEDDAGLSLYQMATLFQELGASTAYNLDGGGTATLWFNGRILNTLVHPGSTTGERSISDMIYLGYD